LSASIAGSVSHPDLVWRLRQSPEVEKIWCAPCNGGTGDGVENDAECASVNVDDVNALGALAERLKPDLTLVTRSFEMFFSI